MKNNLKITIALSLIVCLLHSPTIIAGLEGEYESDLLGLLRDRRYTGLIWNLFFSWIAVGFGRILSDSKTFFFIWLLWLPNTLYMITDLKYWMYKDTNNIYFDSLFFSIYGFLGVSTYYLAIVSRWRQYNYSKRWLTFITFLSAIGVLIGRYFRLYSWDILNINKIIAAINL